MELLPTSIRQLLSASNQNLILTPVDDEIQVFQQTGERSEKLFSVPLSNEIEIHAQDYHLLSGRARICDLRLPGKDVLESSLLLPLAAEENLRQVLAYEMDRLTPFSEAQVYFDYVVKERRPQNQTLSLILYVVLRPTIDRLLKRLTEVRLIPDRISIDPAQTEAVSLINLLPSNFRRNRKLTNFRINLALGFLVLILLASAITLPIIQKRTRIDTIELKLDRELTQAVLVQLLRDQISKLQMESQFLNEQYLKRPSAILIIRELTDILPDNTWLNRLDISGAELQIQGQSEAAALLIQLIESSPLFHNVRFSSSVVKVPRSNTEQFHLSADVTLTGNIQ